MHPVGWFVEILHWYGDIGVATVRNKVAPRVGSLVVWELFGVLATKAMLQYGVVLASALAGLLKCVLRRGLARFVL